ncbi:glutathione S-transferase family protein [Blastochloris viridis]|uniref:Glutathione S-transferase family protein n=1 Tax=Blastochloris viridis TaxID=1079 RepID=A0A0H5BCY6_BLAVI|nr:glutathione S-transferase [Blastochloris viridis]ALK08556.1 putative GST-like protein YibF [Blastochloris viridis]BAR98156.1 glutathione S-transferase family protein [Blastochloris viridis]CUU41219.1 putative glutathione S-transferase [Blastochloris viridis]
MILRSSKPSPFGRKVKIAAALLGLSEKIEIVMADTLDPSDSLRRQNPLGKIPTLILDDGAALFDSRVILEYLDHLAGGGRLLPAEAGSRFATLRLQALADGIMDAALLQVLEARFHAEGARSQTFLDHQAGKVARALAELEAAPPARAGGETAGTIALACALGYLDLRFDGTWRHTHPRLVAWLDGFAADVPAFAATQPA